MKQTLMKGRQDFPTGEPLRTTAGAGTNDTTHIYLIDTLGKEAILDAGLMQVDYNGDKTASDWAGQTITGVLYGRFTNVKADIQLAAYPIILANSED